MGRLSIRLFGAFRAERDGSTLASLNRREGKKLLAYLILHQGEEISYRSLAERFWPAEARGSVVGNGDLTSTRQAIHSLRQALGPDADAIQNVGKGIIRFEVEGWEIDVLEFDAAVAAGTPASLAEARERYRAPLLEDWSDPWVIAARQKRHKEFERIRGSDQVEKHAASPMPRQTFLKHNLPNEADSFIGREKEIRWLLEHLSNERLINVTGPGGSGKTRLVMRFATEHVALLNQFERIVFVDLAPFDTSSLILEAIGRAIDDIEDPENLTIPLLATSIGAQKLLLIPDNCEHQIDICAEICSEIIRRCPNTYILATSRSPLRITGEQVLTIEPLATPDPDQISSTETLRSFDSVRLFLDRAGSMDATFSLDQGNAQDIAEICWYLDGLPLAIELAASRIRSLSVSEINQHLIDRFRLLTGGERNRPARQQTLRALFDWSFQLLSAAEQALFLRLSVFVGGATVEAAKAVSIGSPVPAWEVFDLLRSLTEQSLLRADTHAVPTRYIMLESIRQYGMEKLIENGALSLTRTVHRDYFLSLVENSIHLTESLERDIQMHRMEIEHDNLRAALEWTARQAVADAAEVAGTFLQTLAGLRAYRQQNQVDPTQSPQKTLEQVEAIGKEIAHVGQLATVLGEQQIASFTAPAQGVGNRLREKWWNLSALWETFYLASENGLGLALPERIKAIQEEISEFEGATSGGRLGNLAHLHGDYNNAAQFYESALAAIPRKDPPVIEGFLRNRLGYACLRKGDFREARLQFEIAILLNRSIGSLLLQIRNLGGLAELARAGNDHQSAIEHYSKALILIPGLKRLYEEARLLEGCGCLFHRFTRHSHAVQCWGAAKARRDRIGRPLQRGELALLEPLLNESREIQGGQQFERDWLSGQDMSLTQVSALLKSLASERRH